MIGVLEVLQYYCKLKYTGLSKGESYRKQLVFYISSALQMCFCGSVWCHGVTLNLYELCNCSKLPKECVSHWCHFMLRYQYAAC